MREDGDGRFCERCRLRVTEVAQLDGQRLDQLIGAAERGRVCASFELEDGRPRLGLGVAAGLMIATLSGCATPKPATTEPSAPIYEPKPTVVQTVGWRGRVTGVVVVDRTVEHTSNFVSGWLGIVD